MSTVGGPAPARTATSRRRLQDLGRDLLRDLPSRADQIVEQSLRVARGAGVVDDPPGEGDGLLADVGRGGRFGKGE